MASVKAIDEVMRDPFTFRTDLLLTSDAEGKIHCILQADGDVVHEFEALSVEEALTVLNRKCEDMLR